MLETLTGAVRQEKEIIAVLIRKEEDKLSLYTDHVISYIRELNNSTRKLLEMVNILVYWHIAKSL